MYPTKEKDIIPKRILFILMPKDYQDEEFTVPYNALIAAKHAVDVAGFTTNNARGSRGHEHTPNLILDTLTNDNLKDYDALVIPGGPGSSTYLWNNQVIQDIILFFHEHKKIVATICHACVVLAQTGLLKGKKATVYPSKEALKIFRDHGIDYSDEGCVVLKEENIITADSPQHVQDFAQAILINL